MTEPIPAPDPPDLAVESFLALLGARRSARTVDAYRRDLADLAAFLGRSPAEASGDDVQSWLADLRARGLAASSIARKASAARTFYRHLVLLGQRPDNPEQEEVQQEQEQDPDEPDREDVAVHSGVPERLDHQDRVADPDSVPLP